MRVLLPVDTDEDREIAATKTVTSLPNATETVCVTILNIQEKREVSDKGVEVSSEERYEPEDFPSSVENAKEILENAGISVENRREHADPAKAIIEIADEIDADRIIMAGRK